jgi:Ni/Fe-hydrogenase subunit HybB-like protein
MVVFGVLCERYLIVIPGQTHPPELFPGMEITEVSSPAFQEGPVNYWISIHEVFQAVGVAALIGFAFVLGLWLLKLLPTEARLYEEPSSDGSPMRKELAQVQR